MPTFDEPTIETLLEVALAVAQARKGATPRTLRAAVRELGRAIAAFDDAKERDAVDDALIAAEDLFAARTRLIGALRACGAQVSDPAPRTAAHKLS